MIVERVAGVEIDHRTERPVVERCFGGLVDHDRVEQLGGEDVAIERAIAVGRGAVGRGRDRLHAVDADARALRTATAHGARTPPARVPLDREAGTALARFGQLLIWKLGCVLGAYGLALLAR